MFDWVPNSPLDNSFKDLSKKTLAYKFFLKKNGLILDISLLWIALLVLCYFGKHEVCWIISQDVFLYKIICVKEIFEKNYLLVTNVWSRGHP